MVMQIIITGKPCLEQDKIGMYGYSFRLNMRVCRLDKWLPTFSKYRIRLIVCLSQRFFQDIMNYTLKNLLWIIPFTVFASGYYLMSLLYPAPQLTVPNIIGKSTHDALQSLSSTKLHLKLVGHKEDSDLPEGTILSQNPLPDSSIKANQTIYCITSLKPPVIRVPQLIDKSFNEIISVLQAEKIRYKHYYLPSKAPYNICIGQSPAGGQPLDNKVVIIFLSDGNKKPYIWPSFCGKPVDEVIEFLQKHSLKPTIIHRYPVSPGHMCRECRVVNQRPLAGTFIYSLTDNLKTIQLEVV